MAVQASSVRSGLVWSLSSRIGTQLIQLGISIILARLLSPAQFGAIGMLLVFSGFAQMIADSGLSSALIQKHELEAGDRSTVFWIQAGAGLLLTIVFYGAAGSMAEFFKDPEIAPLSRAMSAIFLLQALGQVHSTMLRRDHKFGYLSIAGIVGPVASGVVAVIMAKLGYGVWALLWQVVLSTAIYTVLMWAGYRWLPRLVFHLRSARTLGGYGIYLLGYTSLNYWLRNGDNVLIGRFLGSVALGLYSRSYGLMLLPVNNIASVFGQVMFPALSRLQHDLDAFRALFLKSVRMIAFASFPIMTGIALLSRQVVLILFGDKWAAMIPVLQILSLAGIYQAAIYPVGWIYNALGRTREQFLLSIVLGVFFALSMWIGLRYGLIGVTIGYALWTILSAVLNVVVAARIVGMRTMTALGSVGAVTVATVVMAVVVYPIDRLLVDWPLLASATTCASIGAAVYIGCCWMLGEETLAIAKPYLARLIRRRVVGSSL